MVYTVGRMKSAAAGLDSILRRGKGGLHPPYNANRRHYDGFHRLNKKTSASALVFY